MNSDKSLLSILDVAVSRARQQRGLYNRNPDMYFAPPVSQKIMRRTLKYQNYLSPDILI
jgi:hypothetical protein